MVKRFEFCPKCKSTNIQTNFGNAVALKMGTPMKMCERCGYQSKFFPTISKKPKLEKIKNNYRPDVQTWFNFERLALAIFGVSFVFCGLVIWLFKLLSEK